MVKNRLFLDPNHLISFFQDEIFTFSWWFWEKIVEKPLNFDQNHPLKWLRSKVTGGKTNWNSLGILTVVPATDQCWFIPLKFDIFEFSWCFLVKMDKKTFTCGPKIPPYCCQKTLYSVKSSKCYIWKYSASVIK